MHLQEVSKPRSSQAVMFGQGEVRTIPHLFDALSHLVSKQATHADVKAPHTAVDAAGNDLRPGRAASNKRRYCSVSAWSTGLIWKSREVRQRSRGAVSSRPHAHLAVMATEVTLSRKGFMLWMGSIDLERQSQTLTA